MNRFVFIAAILLTMIMTGCQDSDLYSQSDSPIETVKVTLNLKITQTASSAVTKTATKGNGKDFNIRFFEGNKTLSSRSEGSTKLHNLWVFQFNASGNKVVSKKISETNTFVNDMTSLDVDLALGNGYKIYIVVLGKKFDDNLSVITTLDALEAYSFPAVEFRNGTFYSIINKNNIADIPYSGFVDGVKIIETSSGSGLVQFTAPSDFIGGIPISRLFSEVNFRYTYNTPQYNAVGVSMKNVPNRFSIAPGKYMKDSSADKVVELMSDESISEGGFYTHQWFIPQNEQGSVNDFVSEDQRYPQGNMVPPQATYMRLFAKHQTDSQYYLIYSIYLGDNNIQSFNVMANSRYNIITDLFLPEIMAKEDNRVEYFELKTGSLMYAYSAIDGTGGTKGIINPTPNQPGYTGRGANYDFDCHYDQRPLYVYESGSRAEVTVIEGTDWLTVSSYGNYTDTKRYSTNLQKAEGTFIVPAQLRFLVFCDEYLDYGTTAPRVGKVKVTVYSNNGTSEESAIYTLRQMPPKNKGRLGGTINSPRGYTHNLLVDNVDEWRIKYDDNTLITTQKMPWGYVGIDPFAGEPVNSIYLPYGHDKIKSGKLLTQYLAENPKGIIVNKNLPNIPQHNGDLYQYNNYNTYAARYCYDKNRDLNGNGKIDYTDQEATNELKWYLPTNAQLQGCWVYRGEFGGESGVLWAADPSSTSSINRVDAGSMAMLGDGAAMFHYHTKDGSTLDGTDLNARCVRDIEDTSDGNNVSFEDGYYVIDARPGMPAVGYENRKENEHKFYQYVPVYKYLKSVDDTPVLVGTFNSNNHTANFEKRIVRHRVSTKGYQWTYKSGSPDPLNVTDYNSLNRTADPIDYYPNLKVSQKFAISPIEVLVPCSKGGTVTSNSLVRWDEASGYLMSARNLPITSAVFALEHGGCHHYGGKNGSEKGKWRLPTQKEMMLIGIHLPTIRQLEATVGSPPFVYSKTTSSFYYTATESAETQGIRSQVMSFVTGGNNSNVRTDEMLVRCIKDLDN